MKSWKVVINYLGNILEVKIEARSYADVYVKVRKEYPDCIVKSISEKKS
jgi:hypothetical protein